MNKKKRLEDFNKLCENTLMETLDITYTDFGEDYLVATMPVTSKVHQPEGILNGGATMALAESVGSPVSYLVLDPNKFAVRGLEFSANHIRSVRSGIITATAKIIHQGRSTHLVEIRVEDEEKRLISLCKITNFILKLET
ncbi:MAG: PaaI family thioesterase [Flavobacteriaceae bacterium]|nr:PaaI family thioesterase [Flavobacteriaceae bacterium]